MSKRFPQNIINLLGIIAVLVLQGANIGFAQSPENKTTYFRIANLSPLGTQKLDLYLGENSLAQQTKPGFFMGYTPFDLKPGSVVFLKSGDQILNSARFPESKAARFFTLLIVSEDSQPKLQILDDSTPEKFDEITGEKIPLKRLRIYSSAYRIPTKIEAGELISWTSKTGGDSLNAEKVFEDTQTNTIKVTFLDDQKMLVDLYYPLDFNSHKGNTVFISQRGPQRLRVESYPDAIEPLEPEEENLESATSEAAGN